MAREMLDTGDWIRLHYGGVLWFDKPPLAMWVTAFFYRVLGISEFSSRLFASLCGVGTVFATYAIGRRLWGSWAGFCSAALLVSSSLFVRTARFGTLDSPLAFFLTLALGFFWLGLERPAWFWACGAALGAAAMTKGFAAAVFFPVVLIFAAWSGHWRSPLRREFLGALALAFLIALPWHAVQVREFPDAFWKDVVVKHLLTRTTQAVEGHPGGWFFYFRVVLNKFRPAIFAGVAAIPWFLARAARRRSADLTFVASWIVGGFLLATLVRTKLDWYIFPVLPALSLATGWALSRWMPPRFFVALAVVAALSVGLHGFHSRRFFQDYSAPVKALAETVRREVPPGDFVYLVRYHEDPAVTFYWQRRCMDLDDEASLASAAEKRPFHALIRAEDYDLWKTTLEKRGIGIKKRLDGFYWVSSPAVV